MHLLIKALVHIRDYYFASKDQSAAAILLIPLIRSKVLKNDLLSGKQLQGQVMK